MPLAGVPATLLLAACLTGCDPEKPRVYSEVAFKPLSAPMSDMPGMASIAAPPAGLKVTWTLPEGWVPKDSANAFRIGSFAAMEPALAYTGEIDPNAVDVSVVLLGGTAGGLEANVRRWMDQIGVRTAPAELAEFIRKAPRFQTATGQEGLFIDLTDKLSGDLTQSNTIFGAIVETGEYTVFVKAMGGFSRVIRQKPEVTAFCGSLRIVEPRK